MIKKILTLSSLSLLAISAVDARGPNPSDISANPQEMGTPGIAWYTTWETGIAEAKRSQRPIFFMVAAAQCNGTPGVF